MNDMSWTREQLLDHYRQIRERLNKGPELVEGPVFPTARMVVPDAQTLRMMSVKVETLEPSKTAKEAEKRQRVRTIQVRDFMEVASRPLSPDADMGQLIDFSSLSVREIVAYCSVHYNVSYIDIQSERRTTHITFARQVACWLAKTYTFKSLPMIGRGVGGRDHTTILHAVRKIQKLIDARRFVPPEFDADKALIARRIVGARVFLKPQSTALNFVAANENAGTV